jgi:phospholipid/cholesterol/gamma-HCH transport system substrate-binding protein
MRTPVSRIEKIAGVFVLVTIVPLAALVLVPQLRPGGFFRRSPFIFYVKVDRGLDLAAGDKITMNGLQIGMVDELEMLPDHRIRVRCSVFERYRERITRDVRAVLVPAPIVGSGKIDIEPGVGELLAPETEIEGVLEPSITDRADELLVEVGVILENANRRIGQLGNTLDSFQTILDQINEGKGSLGRFVYEAEFYERLSELVRKLESSAETISHFQEPVLVLAEQLPILTRTALEAAAKLDVALTKLRDGLERFPETTTKVIIALDEGRKVLESLKRNILIRGNIPIDVVPEGMAPVSRRASLSGTTP